MAKRFTDTGKWDRAWYRKLEPRLKCAWDYLVDRCDHAGIWNIDIDLMGYYIGEPVSEKELEQTFKLVRFDEDKFFIPNFVQFQYGELQPTNNAHRSVLKRLKECGLDLPLASPSPAPAEPLTRGCPGDQDKDQDQDKDLDKDQEGGVGETKLPPPAARAPGAVTREQVDACVAAWQDTCLKFRCDHPLTETEQVTIARACQVWGGPSVELALIGARFEPAGRDYDPSKNVSLSRILPLHLTVQDGREAKFERLRNIGIQAWRDGKAVSRIQAKPKPEATS